MEWFIKLNQYLARRTGTYDAAKSKKANFWKWALLGATIVFGLVRYGPQYSKFLATYFDPLKAEVGIKQYWKYTIKDSPVNEEGIPIFALPGQGELWTGSNYRNRWKLRNKFWKKETNEIWLGGEIPTDVLKKALELGANTLYLGEIWNVNFELYIDGKKFLSGSHRDGAIISHLISDNRLKREKNLFIAIKMAQHFKANTTKILNDSKESGEGFVTTDTMRKIERNINFIYYNRPFALFFLYGCVFLLFISLWRNNKKPEIFYFAWGNLILSLIQLRGIPFYFVNEVPIDLRHTMYFLRVMEGASIVMFSMAFARVKPKILLGTFILFSLFGLTIFFQKNFSQLTWQNIYYSRYFFPYTYMLGSIICFGQSFLLNSKGQGGVYHPKRAKHLLNMGLCLLVMCGLYQVLYSSRFNSLIVYKRVFNYRTLQLTLIFYMYFLLTMEHKLKEELLSKVPISKFHKLRPLPDSVYGLVFILDLKNSEFLFKENSEGKLMKDVVNDWRKCVYVAASEVGAEVMGHAGDEVKVFFPSNADEREMTLDKLEKFLAKYSEGVSDLKASLDILTTNEDVLNFPFYVRAACAFGGVRPLLEDVGEGKIPSWEQTGESGVFLEVSRLLELEKHVPGSKDNNYFILQDSFDLSGNLEKQVLHSNIELKGKHDVKYIVKVLSLSSNNLLNEAA